MHVPNVTLRAALCGLALVVTSPMLNADEVLAELEEVPEGLIGTWRAGGRSYIANDKTEFDLDHPATVGRLVEIEFTERDGVAIAEEIEPQPFGPEALDDGPYVFWRDANTVEIVNFRDGKVTRETRTEITEPIEYPHPHEGMPAIQLDPSAPTTPSSSWKAPSRLLAVSDLEGNHETFVRFLRNNGVIDEGGHWAWGDGHLVFNGDIVDRGDQVTEILWFIRGLEREAHEAGGRVHFVLGNHETMVMAGDLRYIHPKYQFTSDRLGIKYEDLYGPSTEIGRWFRTRNTIERIGNLLFVHAGYSPALDQLALELDPINQGIRSGLGPPAWPSREDLATRLIWHQQGPLWYRGYFEKYADQWGGLPTEEQLNSILTRHEVDHIVVGHTVVDDIGWLHDEEYLIGIDVKWSKAGEGEGLLLENGVLSRVDMDGKRRTLDVVQRPLTPSAPTVR